MRRAPPRVTANLQEKNGRFYIVARIPETSGKYKQRWISTGLPVEGNKRKAKQLLGERLLELQSEHERKQRIAGWCAEEIGEMPFLNVADRWLARKRPSLAPSTVEGYQKIMRRLRQFFQPLELTMREVSPTILSDYVAQRLEDGASANTVRHDLTLIKSVFNDEIKNGAPLLNPVKCVKPQKIETFEAATYSVDQLGALFELFKGDEIEDIVLIAVLYGLRRSEICGLRWRDIDWENGTVHIRHKVSEVKVDGQRRLIRSDSLKTESSRRSFPLSALVREQLQTRKNNVQKNMEKEGYNNAFLEYVFVRDDGNLITPDRVTDRFRAKIKSSELPPLRFHDLRHTCATLLLQEGCSLREIQSYLGHATYITTTRYAHVDGRSKQHALDTLDQILLQKKE